MRGRLFRHQNISNVPGPQEPVAFAGSRLKKVHFCFNNIMPNVSRRRSHDLIAMARTAAATVNGKSRIQVVLFLAPSKWSRATSMPVLS